MSHPGDPEGFAEKPRPLPYYVLDKHSGARVVRYTEPALDTINERYYHAFSSSDQKMADEAAMLMQRACGYFYLSDDEYKPLEGWADARVTDDEVHERIHRINAGENARELARVQRIKFTQSGAGPNTVAFDFEALPWGQQRALIEMIDEIKYNWQFEWIDPDTLSGMPYTVATVQESLPVYFSIEAGYVEEI